MKSLVLKEDNVTYLWTDELVPENVGIIWDKNYAELIKKALEMYQKSV